MRAVILAAGFGSRLRPLTHTTPKPLLPVYDKPLIAWNLLLLRQHGVTEVVINLHHLGDQISTAIGDGSRYGMKISYSREPRILGTGGGIKQAVESLSNPPDKPFVVLNGDTLMDLNLSAMVTYHIDRGGLATLAVRDDPDVEKWGAVELDQRNHIVRIAGRGRSPSNIAVHPIRRMFAGAHVISPQLLQTVPQGKESSIIDAYVQWLERGAEIYGFPFEGYWSDVGTPERYAEAQLDAEAGRLNWLDLS